MAKWDPIRRARDNLRPHRSMSLLPSSMRVVFDELRALKNNVKKLEGQQQRMAVRLKSMRIQDSV